MESGEPSIVTDTGWRRLGMSDLARVSKRPPRQPRDTRQRRLTWYATLFKKSLLFFTWITITHVTYHLMKKKKNIEFIIFHFHTRVGGKFPLYGVCFDSACASTAGNTLWVADNRNTIVGLESMWHYVPLLRQSTNLIKIHMANASKLTSTKKTTMNCNEFCNDA